MRSNAHLSSHPIHPMLVVFPLGLWISSFVFDVLGIATKNGLLWVTGFYMIIGGCIGALAAAIPGAIDWTKSIPPKSSAKKRGLIHAVLNVSILCMFIFEAIHRGSALRQPDGISLGVSAVAVAVLGYSGWLGGTLSYRNQIGVDHRYANAGKFKEREIESWEKPACNVSELGDGQMMLVRIAGERVAVARSSEGVVAFSDHCTHKGGPLCDGALIGNTVQCPWHGSQFDVRTGRVVSGPAEEKIGTYEVEITNNEVYIQPKKPRKDEPGEKRAA
jgi:nitrite reductase/ring-hydroxylating ferredoxin subunit/uncharacterized membrane protein